MGSGQKKLAVQREYDNMGIEKCAILRFGRNSKSDQKQSKNRMTRPLAMAMFTIICLRDCRREYHGQHRLRIERFLL